MRSFVLPDNTYPIKQSSVFKTQDGIIFDSEKGIVFLSKGFQISYIGNRVDDFKDQRVGGGI